MEDGSAVPVEQILIQAGALGFYQKRLFLCSCFLQALTVSALIYASHCRPDIAPPTPATATNGGLVHLPKCSDLVSQSTPQDGSKDTFETSSHRLSARNETVSGSDVPGNINQTEQFSDTGSSNDSVSITHDRGHKRSAHILTTHMPYFYTSESGTKRGTDSSVTEEDSISLSSNRVQNNDQTSPAVPNKRRHSKKKEGRHRKDTVRTTEVPVTTAASDNAQNGIAESITDSESSDQVSHKGLVNQLTTEDYHARDTTEASPHMFGVSTRGTTTPHNGVTSLSDDITTSVTAPDTGHSNDVHGQKDVKSSSVLDVTRSTIQDVKHTDCTEESHGNDKNQPFYVTLTYLPTPEWLREADQYKLAQYNAYCQAVGAIVGAALGAMGADQLGRRRPLFVYFPLMLIAHCLSGFAVSWTMLAVLRFLVGVFAGATAVVSMVFPLEFIGAEYRDACVCSGIWVVGAVVISLELLVTRHWRYLAFISGGVGLPLIGIYFIVSESARWLLCHQKFPDAENTLKEIMSCNSSSVTEFMSLFDKSRACVVTNMHPKRYTFLDLFHSLEMTKWTLALVYTCLVASAVYFCLLAKVKEMTGIVYVDSSLPFVIDLPLGWSAVVVNRCLGRRWCLFLYAVASGLALLSVLVLHMTGNLSHMPSMLTGMAVFGKIGVTASLGLVFVIAVEMYPTVVRCMGVAMGVMAVTGGSLLSEVFHFLEAYHYTVPFVVFGAMMASVGFAGLLFPETLYRPLPNILPCRHRTIPLHEGDLPHWHREAPPSHHRQHLYQEHVHPPFVIEGEQLPSSLAFTILQGKEFFEDQVPNGVV